MLSDGDANGGDRPEDCTQSESGGDNCSDEDNGTAGGGKLVSVWLVLLLIFFPSFPL